MVKINAAEGKYPDFLNMSQAEKMMTSLRLFSWRSHRRRYSDVSTDWAVLTTKNTLIFLCKSSLVSLQVERRAYIFPAEWWWWSVLWTPRRSSACPSLSWPAAGKEGPAATDRKWIRWVFCLQQDGASDGCVTAELSVWGLKNTERGQIYSISIKLAPALEFSILLNTNYHLEVLCSSKRRDVDCKPNYM